MQSKTDSERVREGLVKAKRTVEAFVKAVESLGKAARAAGVSIDYFHCNTRAAESVRRKGTR